MLVRDLKIQVQQNPGWIKSPTGVFLTYIILFLTYQSDSNEYYKQ